jgi:hypothetical protein
LRIFPTHIGHRAVAQVVGGGCAAPDEWRTGACVGDVDGVERIGDRRIRNGERREAEAMLRRLFAVRLASSAIGFRQRAEFVFRRSHQEWLRWQEDKIRQEIGAFHRRRW